MNTYLKNLFNKPIIIKNDRYNLYNFDVVEKYKEELNWDEISKKNLSYDFIDKFKNKINWCILSIYKKFDNTSLEKYNKYITPTDI
jgi:hypothetical protein